MDLAGIAGPFIGVAVARLFGLATLEHFSSLLTLSSMAIQLTMSETLKPEDRKPFKFSTANPFSNWLTWASNTSLIPWVHSLSVGEPEDEFASDNGGEAAVSRMNHEMAAVGARGVSILFASGDSGSGYARERCAFQPGFRPNTAHVGTVSAHQPSPSALKCCGLSGGAR